jgi:hypothetical protein
MAGVMMVPSRTSMKYAPATSKANALGNGGLWSVATAAI